MMMMMMMVVVVVVIHARRLHTNAVESAGSYAS